MLSGEQGSPGIQLFPGAAPALIAMWTLVLGLHRRTGPGKSLPCQGLAGTPTAGGAEPSGQAYVGWPCRQTALCLH